MTRHAQLDLERRLTYDAATDRVDFDAADLTWTATSGWFGTLGFERREIGLAVAIQNAWARLVCRLTRHVWVRHSYYEGEPGWGWEEEWWECSRCEAFSYEDPA